MTTRTIVLPLDGSELAERALAAATRLARARDATLLLLRVAAERPWPEGAAQAAAIEDAERYLAEIAAGLAAEGLRTRLHACAGEAAEEILRGAALHRADMVVMATHGRGGLGRLLHGSVADAVVRHAKVPVLLVPSRCAAPTLAGEAVLVAVDGSAFAETAVGHAAELARELAMPLTVLRTIVWGPLAVDGWAAPPDALARLVDDDRAYVEGVAESVRRVGVEARGAVVAGPPGLAVADYAHAADAAVIVMATHGRDPLRRLAFGSVATDVLTHARRPLLLIHPRVPVGAREHMDAGAALRLGLGVV